MTGDPILAVPLAVEPDPFLDPTVVVFAPVDVVHTLGVVRMRIVREDEDDLAAERRRDLVLVSEDIIPFTLAVVGIHLLCPFDHGVAEDRLLVSLEEDEVVKGLAAERHLVREFRPNGIHCFVPLLDFLQNTLTINAKSLLVNRYSLTYN